MRFGNIGSVLDNEKNLFEALSENNSGNHVKKPSKISILLKSLSHYGMNYDDQVYKNMKAIPADQNINKDINNDVMNAQMLWGGGYDNWKIKPEEEKPFSAKSLSQKRDVLRKMAMQNELEDILDVMTNEAVVPDENEAYICTPFIDNGMVQDLNEEHAEKIRSSINTSFYKLYMLLDWKKEAWNEFKRWLIDGVLAFEIVYDSLENPHTIIGIVALDPVTLTKVIKNGITYWVQYKDVIGRERKLLDSQIIYIKYEDSGVTERQSYLERLIRPFNIYRIIEQAQVIWTVTQSSFKTIFTIPVTGMSRAKGAQTLRMAMNRYKEDITFNTETGELLVNGRVNLPFNQEYWMPENENGKPEIETLTDSGPQLNDSDQITYFEHKLHKMSKIPESRFDKDAQSTWFGTDPTQALREEINFTRFVNRLRDTFSEILLKPLKIQLSLSMPEIKNDKRILDSISLRFNSYNLFEEMQNIEVMQKRIDFIGSFKDAFTVQDAEGNEQPFFSQKFLIMKYLKMTDADLELNEKYKLEEKVNASKTDKEAKSESEEENDEEEEDFGLGGDEEENEKEEEINPEENEENEIDSEMLGDVKPESPETTTA